MRDRTLLLAAMLATAAASCGRAPANVAGTYTIGVTNGPNECMVNDWTEGATTNGIELVVTQDGASFTADVTGIAGAYLDLVIGGSTFTGTVSGTRLFATLRGRPGAMGSCAYTLNVDLDAELSGDFLSGQLVYYADTNDSPDCGMYAACRNVQSFNGSRPPRLEE